MSGRGGEAQRARGGLSPIAGLAARRSRAAATAGGQLAVGPATVRTELVTVTTALGCASDGPPSRRSSLEPRVQGRHLRLTSHTMPFAHCRATLDQPTSTCEVLAGMTSSDIAAVAAIAAVVISIANVALTSYLARRREYQQWTRALLPDLILKFKDASSRHDDATREADWLNIDLDESSYPGQAEFAEMTRLYDSLEVFASSRTLNAAYEVMATTDILRINRYEMAYADNEAREEWNKNIGKMCRTKSDADRMFVRAARLEMGLRPLSGECTRIP